MKIKNAGTQQPSNDHSLDGPIQDPEGRGERLSIRPQTMMPVLFVGHGNPLNAIQDNRWSRSFRDLGTSIPKPRAILAISAHYYTNGTRITGDESPRTIHDFGGFPPELYAVQYPAPGNPGLAVRCADRLSHLGAEVRTDWGIDHGTWSVLRHMYPKADVPIVQLSIDAKASMQTHWDVGRALAPLREEGVLIVGSGNLVHNLPRAFRKWRSGLEEPESRSRTFDERVSQALEQRDQRWLLHALDDEDGREAHPTPDHYLPVLYAAGASGSADVTFPIEGFDMGDISMRTVLFEE